MQREQVAETSKKRRTQPLQDSEEQSRVPIHPILHLQQTVGNQAVGRLLRSGVIQAKLRVSQPNNPHEQEADRIADEVMRMEEPDCLEGKAEEGLIQSKLFGNSLPNPSSLDSQIRLFQGQGQPLPTSIRQLFEPRFGVDLSQVRIHHNDLTAKFADSIQARAFTKGHHIGFNQGEYDISSYDGKHLLAHELVHGVSESIYRSSPIIWREGVRVGSPVIDETLMQYTAIWGAGRGRPLSREEVALARSVFGNSLDYSRVRFIPSETRGVDWRVVGNTIREPQGFTITNSYMAHTFIHELTHVWQYQHFGSSYISLSLFANLGGIIAHGRRGAAYDYRIIPGQSFFEYTVEQQASIVQHYFIAVRRISDPTSSPDLRANATRRRDERQPLIDQMRAVLPRTEADLLLLRARDVVGGVPSPYIPEPPAERRMLPIRPILSIEW